jgi:hypothetical protein
VVLEPLKEVSMKKGTCLSALLLLVLTALTIQAKPFMWWNEPGPQPVEQPSEVMAATTGDCKTLIILSKFPEDTAILYPPLYDSLIAPSIDSMDDSLYMWSVTDFLKIT